MESSQSGLNKENTFQFQIAYYIDESSVGGDVNQVQAIEKQGTRSSQWSMGYGKDTGGGDTVGILR